MPGTKGAFGSGFAVGVSLDGFIIPDRETTGFMMQFYGRLVKGMPVRDTFGAAEHAP